MKAKDAAKSLKKLINDEKFMKKVYESANNNCDFVYHALGNALSFIILTNGKVKIDEPCLDLFQYIKKYNININDPNVKDMCNKNVLENPLMTHSFNGGNLRNAKKYGLGVSKVYDKRLAEYLTELEENLGKSIFIDNQANTSNELYFCSPGVKSFYYACAQSPERLYLGILKQDRNSALPIIVGEKKEDYMLRVVYDKINRLNSIEDQAKLRAEAKYVIKCFCSRRPVISLFSTISKKYNLNVGHATSKKEIKPVSEMIESNVGDGFLDYFSQNSNEAEDNNLGNLVSIGSAIPASELGFVEVPDQFEMMQRFAKIRGFKKGDKIDYFTGEKYEEKDLVEENDNNIEKENSTEENQDVVEKNTTKEEQDVVEKRKKVAKHKKILKEKESLEEQSSENGMEL